MNTFILRVMMPVAVLIFIGGCGLVNPVSGYKVDCDGRKITAIIPKWGAGHIYIDDRRILATYERLEPKDKQSPITFDFFDGNRQARLTIIYYGANVEASDAFPDPGVSITESATLEYLDADEPAQTCAQPSRFFT